MNWLKKVNNNSTTDASDLVKKTDYNTKIDEIETKINDQDHTKYITTKLTSKNVCFKISARKLIKEK